MILASNMMRSLKICSEYEVRETFLPICTNLKTQQYRFFIDIFFQMRISGININNLNRKINLCLFNIHLLDKQLYITITKKLEKYIS